MNMILLADSGSTKTDWCVVDSGKEVMRIRTKGINPFFQSEEEIASELAKALVPQLLDVHFERICFYGAGCAFDKVDRVRRALSSVLRSDNEPEVASDMLAAAHALCGHRPGIACILGTGSNSCFYNGEVIERNVSPLGFILGDEGSGASLGKHLVADVLKNQLDASLVEAFQQAYGLTAPQIIDCVYRQPFPNRFLAGFSPFLSQHQQHPSVRRLIAQDFEGFFRRNVKQYDYQSHEVHFVGSIAYHYQEILKEVALAEGIRIGRIYQSPLEGLIIYHTHP